MSDLQIRVIDWQTTPALREIRQRVFVEEQRVAPELEWDQHDLVASHFLLSLDGRPLGTARLLDNGRIGRVALLPEARGKGLGMKLMQAVMHHGREKGMQQLELSAQTHALGFYQQLGFVVCSEVHDDAGLPHQRMRWSASAD